MMMRTIRQITPRIIIIWKEATIVTQQSLIALYSYSSNPKLHWPQKPQLPAATEFFITQLKLASQRNEQSRHQPALFMFQLLFVYLFVCKRGLFQAAPIHTHTSVTWARLSPCPHLGILPPVFILQFRSAGLKLRGSSLQGIGPVVQLRQLLITLQHLIHVYTHDVHHLGERHTTWPISSQTDAADETSHSSCYCCVSFTSACGVRRERRTAPGPLCSPRPPAPASAADDGCWWGWEAESVHLLQEGLQLGQTWGHTHIFHS